MPDIVSEVIDSSRYACLRVALLTQENYYSITQLMQAIVAFYDLEVNCTY